MVDVTGIAGAVCRVVACLVGGITAYGADLPAWVAGVLALAVYGAMVVVNTWRVRRGGSAPETEPRT